jgi:hypothetical protein
MKNVRLSTALQGKIKDQRENCSWGMSMLSTKSSLPGPACAGPQSIPPSLSPGMFNTRRPSLSKPVRPSDEQAKKTPGRCATLRLNQVPGSVVRIIPLASRISKPLSSRTCVQNLQAVVIAHVHTAGTKAAGFLTSVADGALLSIERRSGGQSA